MTERLLYEILLDMNKEIGKQEILKEVMLDLASVTESKLYWNYHTKLSESNKKYAELETEYNNTINKQ